MFGYLPTVVAMSEVSPSLTGYSYLLTGLAYGDWLMTTTTVGVL